MTDRDAVIDIIKRLPEDCSVRDMMYELYVYERITAGLADIRAGRVVPHEQVMQEVRAWLESNGR